MSSSALEVNEPKGDDQKISKLKSSALFDGSFFSITSIKENKVEAKCELCVTKDVRLKGCYPSTSNFIKHIKAKHQGSFEKYQEHKRKLSTQKRSNS